MEQAFGLLLNAVRLLCSAPESHSWSSTDKSACHKIYKIGRQIRLGNVKLRMYNDVYDITEPGELPIYAEYQVIQVLVRRTLVLDVASRDPALEGTVNAPARSFLVRKFVPDNWITEVFSALADILLQDRQSHAA